MHRHRPVPESPRLPQPTPLALCPVIHAKRIGAAAGAAPGHGVGGCTGAQHPFAAPPPLGQAATGSSPMAPSSRSRHPARHRWLQRPAALRGSSVLASTIRYPHALASPAARRGLPQCPWPGEWQQEPLGVAATLRYRRARGNRAAPTAASHARPGHCTTIGFAAALPFTAWKLNCKMSKTFPNCAILAWFY